MVSATELRLSLINIAALVKGFNYTTLLVTNKLKSMKEIPFRFTALKSPKRV